MKKAPRNKAEFYRRWHRGEFGNKLRAWPSYADLVEGDYRGNVSIRSMEWSASKVQYHVPFDSILTTIRDKMGVAVADCQFNESAPDTRLIGQGELLIHTFGYYLYWSYLKMPMRTALNQGGKEYKGLMALGMLKVHCWSGSYEHLQELLDRYPEAVIEFGCYETEVGNLPGHNTLIWEVRNY